MAAVAPDPAMNDRPVCGKCGTSLAPDAPEGLCLQCLLDTAKIDAAQAKRGARATR